MDTVPFITRKESVEVKVTEWLLDLCKTFYYKKEYHFDNYETNKNNTSGRTRWLLH